MNCKLLNLNEYFNNDDCVDSFFEDDLVINTIELLLSTFKIKVLKVGSYYGVKEFISDYIGEDVTCTVFYATNSDLDHTLDYERYDIVVFDSIIDDKTINKLLKPITMKVFL